MNTVSARCPGDLAAVCCLFNPCGYRSRSANYRRFRAGVNRAGLPLLTVELAFGRVPFELQPEPSVMQLRGGDVMWQKERLLQIGAERLVAEGWRKILFLDADVLFDSDDWPARVSTALERHPLVQCFSEATLSFDDLAIRKAGGVLAFDETGVCKGTSKGLAWAMRAEVVERAGLYTHCVVGAGDSALFYAAIGKFETGGVWRAIAADHPFLRYPGERMAADYQAWADRLHAAMEASPGCITGGVRTLAHGTFPTRQYYERHRLLAQFDPAVEISAQQDGALSWTGHGRWRAASVAAYFRGRAEDGTPLDAAEAVAARGWAAA